MKTIIFSDVHLHVVKDGKSRMDIFLRFLKQLNSSEIKRIIVLGDLFDFWFEYKEVIFSEYFDILRAFADLREQGVELILICGNHDFWAGRFLQDHIGFIVHREPVILDLFSRKVLLTHGDGINPTDYGYRIYKLFARARIVVWFFSLIHPDLAMRIARFVSHGSRSLNKEESECGGAEAKALQTFAKGKLESGEVQIVMCGHCHYPVIEELSTGNGTGLYINSGDWVRHFSYVEWDGTKFSMKYFEAK